MFKTCANCKLDKTLDLFYKNVSRKRYANDLNKVQNTCIECHRSLRKAHYQSNRDVYKNKHLIRSYGITLDQYNSLKQKQDNRCASCNNHETRISKFTGELSDLAVDHCHASGRIRGLLCFKCNMALGLLKDDKSILKSLMVYLDEK